MSRPKVRYLIAKPGRSGRVRWFWQPSADLRARGWHPHRLADELGQAITEAEKLNADLDAWRRGETIHEGARAQPGSVGALINAYKASRHYTKLRASTRRGYDQCLRWIDSWAGDAPARAITPRLVQRFYEGMVTETPAKANATLRVLRLLLEYARREDWIGANPASRPGLIGNAEKGRVWSAEAVAFFVEAADKMGLHSIGTAIMLDEWLGQRQGDVLALPRAAYRDARITVAQSKTGAVVELPIGMVPALVDRLEAELQRQRDKKLAGTALLLCEATGQPWKADFFRHEFARVREKAAAKWPECEGLWFMHLRHTAVTRLAEAGCELPMIAAVTGHTLAGCQTIIDRYLVRTAGMARAAFAKRIAKETSP